MNILKFGSKLFLFFAFALMLKPDGASAFLANLGFWNKSCFRGWLGLATVSAWRAIAVSADGQKLVGVVYGGQIYTSTNGGTSWTPRDSNRNWVGVASSADGSTLAAIVENGNIYVSTDSGVTWIPRASVLLWSSIAVSADGTKMIAADQGTAAYTSTNSGTNWTPQAGVQPIVVGISLDGSRMFAAHWNGGAYYSNNDGANWSASTGVPNAAWTQFAPSTDGLKVIISAAGNKQLYTSTNGGTSYIARGVAKDWYSVTSSSDGSRAVAAEVTDQKLYYTTDSGVNWTQLSTSPTQFWYKAAISSDGKVIFAAPDNGQIYTSSCR